MLNCERVTTLCSEEMERQLTLRERISLAFHTMMCVGCANYRVQMAAIRTAMRRYAEGRARSTTDDGEPRAS